MTFNQVDKYPNIKIFLRKKLIQMFLQGSVSGIRQRIASELLSGCLFSEISNKSLPVSLSHLLSSVDVSNVASDSDLQSEGSDSESETTANRTHCCKRVSHVPPISQSSSDSELDISQLPKSWCQLRPELQSVLPPNDSYTYIIEMFQNLDPHTFSGAHSTNFTTEFRVNLEDEEQAREWVNLMSKQCKCTYRVTRTYSLHLREFCSKQTCTANTSEKR